MGGRLVPSGQSMLNGSAHGAWWTVHCHVSSSFGSAERNVGRYGRSGTIPSPNELHNQFDIELGRVETQSSLAVAWCDAFKPNLLNGLCQSLLEKT